MALEVVEPRKVSVFNVLSDQEICILEDVPPGPLYGFTWSQDGASVVARNCADPATVLVWDTKSGRLRSMFRPDYTTAPYTFSPNGKIVAASSAHAEIQLFDADTGRLLRTLPPVAEGGGARHTAWSSDGKTLAVSSYGKGEVRAWNIETGSLLGRRAMSPSRKHVAIMGDPARLAVVGQDGGISIWQPPSLLWESGSGITRENPVPIGSMKTRSVNGSQDS